VSPRQKGNPILNHVQSVPWEYADIPADYVLGSTTCALFLSLKYHRLHPEYIYSRIRLLAGKYKLRVLLTMVDIENHEDPLKELAKTGLVNNLTLILCWSAAEAGRYLSLFKSFEHAPPTSIRAQQARSYSEQLVEFVTVPKSINKTDVISLVGNFGSLRAAINAQPEEIALIGGWGDKKVANWCSSVREGFRPKKARKRGGLDAHREDSRAESSRDADRGRDESVEPRPPPIPIGMLPSREPARSGPDEAAKRPIASQPPAADDFDYGPDSDEEEALLASIQTTANRPLRQAGAVSSPVKTASASETVEKNQDNRNDSNKQPPDASSGIMAALAKLREKG
jgi:DNA excision repair protein ERCC-1